MFGAKLIFFRFWLSFWVPLGLILGPSGLNLMKSLKIFANKFSLDGWVSWLVRKIIWVGCLVRLVDIVVVGGGGVGVAGVAGVVGVVTEQSNQHNEDRKNSKDKKDNKDNPTIHDPINMARRNARSD